MHLELTDKARAEMEYAKLRYHQFLYSLSNDDYPKWQGVPLQKNPLDLWTYIEIIQKVKPDIILECGTALGSSAAFFSAIQKTVKPKGHVITIDKKVEYKLHAKKFDNSNIMHISGTTQSTVIANVVYDQIKPQDVVFVSLDAGHHVDQVYKELELYSPLVTPGSYIVVEDSNIDVTIKTGYTGPGEAIKMFLEHNKEFTPDSRCERFGVTYNPGGWLKRIKL